MRARRLTGMVAATLAMLAPAAANVPTNDPALTAKILLVQWPTSRA